MTGGEEVCSVDVCVRVIRDKEVKFGGVEVLHCQRFVV